MTLCIISEVGPPASVGGAKGTKASHLRMGRFFFMGHFMGHNAQKYREYIDRKMDNVLLLTQGNFLVLIRGKSVIE